LRQANNMVVSFTVTDNLTRLNDPRLPVFARPASKPGGTYRGVPLQLTPDQSLRYKIDSISLMGKYFLDTVFNIIVINAAEVKFLRAEAALAGLTTETAQDLYQAGIQAAMGQYGVDGTATQNYLASPAGTISGTDEEKLEQIIIQKWLGNYYN